MESKNAKFLEHELISLMYGSLADLCIMWSHEHPNKILIFKEIDLNIINGGYLRELP